MSAKNKEENKFQRELINKNDFLEIAKEPDKSHLTPDIHNTSKTSNAGKSKKVIPKLKLN